MSSELQQIASRANGAKSLGPVTDEGKQASSQNRRTHGLLSKKVVLEGESQEEFDELLASYLEEHQPQTPTERSLIESMAAARWRQERVWGLETAGLDHQIRNPRYFEAEDYATQAFVAFRTLSDDTRSLELLNRYEARFERQFRAALTALQKLQAQRAAAARTKLPPDPDPDSPASPQKRFRLIWVDEFGNKTVAADSRPDLDPPPDDDLEIAASGSNGNRPFLLPAAKKHCVSAARQSNVRHDTGETRQPEYPHLRLKRAA